MKKIIVVLLLFLAGFAREAYSQVVARIGETEYATLAEAYDHVQNGQTITMIHDVVINSTMLVTGVNFTLDLNGKKITCDDSRYVNNTFMQVGTDGDVTITDSSDEQNGVITCADDNGNLYPIALDKKGRLTINAGSIISPEEPTKGFCAVSILDGGTLIVNGGTLSTTQGNDGTPPAVIYNLGTTIINGGIIENTYNSTNNVRARGIMNNGTLYVYGGTISSREYAIYNFRKGTLTLNSSVGIDGEIFRYNDNPIDKYILTDNADLNMKASITANTITYNRGSSNAFGTVCLPFVPDAKEGITYYTQKEATSSTLTLEEVTTLTANTPYVYFTEDGTYNVSKASTTTLAANPAAGTTFNDGGWSLKGVYKSTSVFSNESDAAYDATNDSHVVEPNSYYIKDNGFSKTSGYVVIKPFRAYITAPDGSGSSNYYEISVIDEATAVKSFFDEGNEITAIYDANGVKLKKLQHGVNIVVCGNGKTKKVIVK